MLRKEENGIFLFFFIGSGLEIFVWTWTHGAPLNPFFYWFDLHLIIYY